MKLRFLSAKKMISALFLLPAMAHADFTIINKTNLPSTSYLNFGACSTTIKKYGTTYPNQTNVVPHNKLLLACGYAPVCAAIVFMNDHCSANSHGVVPINDNSQVGSFDSVAIVEINTDNDSIKSIKDSYSHYKVIPINNGHGAMLVDTNLSLKAKMQDHQWLSSLMKKVAEHQ